MIVDNYTFRWVTAVTYRWVTAVTVIILFVTIVVCLLPVNTTYKSLYSLLYT